MAAVIEDERYGLGVPVGIPHCSTCSGMGAPKPAMRGGLLGGLALERQGAAGKLRLTVARWMCTEPCKGRLQGINQMGCQRAAEIGPRMNLWS